VPHAAFGAHRAGAARAYEKVLVNHSVEGEHRFRIGPCRVKRPSDLIKRRSGGDTTAKPAVRSAADYGAIGHVVRVS
jgi:hypothetical protein